MKKIILHIAITIIAIEMISLPSIAFYNHQHRPTWMPPGWKILCNGNGLFSLQDENGMTFSYNPFYKTRQGAIDRAWEVVGIRKEREGRESNPDFTGFDVCPKQ